MIREMYRHPQLSHWKVVFVTARTQLEQQLREISQNIGFTIKIAGSIAKLKELLPGDSSDLVMVMIHKFQERLRILVYGSRQSYLEAKDTITAKAKARKPSKTIRNFSSADYFLRVLRLMSLTTCSDLNVLPIIDPPL